MNKPSKDNYEIVLNSLRTKLNRLKVKYEEESFHLELAIEAIEAEMEGAGLPDSAVQISPRLFRGLTVGEAVLKYLKKFGDRKTRSQAIDALLAGGIGCTADKPRHSIRNNMMTAKEYGTKYELNEDKLLVRI